MTLISYFNAILIVFYQYFTILSTINKEIIINNNNKRIFPSICQLPFQIKVLRENIRTKRETSEAYSEPDRTSKIKLFAKILRNFHILTIVFIV